MRLHPISCRSIPVRRPYRPLNQTRTIPFYVQRRPSSQILNKTCVIRQGKCLSQVNKCQSSSIRANPLLAIERETDRQRVNRHLRRRKMVR